MAARPRGDCAPVHQFRTTLDGTLRAADPLNPHLGRVGAEPGIRELVIGLTPYIILYRVRSQRVVISAIWRSAQKR